MNFKNPVFPSSSILRIYMPEFRFTTSSSRLLPFIFLRSTSFPITSITLTIAASPEVFSILSKSEAGLG